MITENIISIDHQLQAETSHQFQDLIDDLESEIGELCQDYEVTASYLPSCNQQHKLQTIFDALQLKLTTNKVADDDELMTRLKDVFVSGSTEISKLEL